MLQPASPNSFQHSLPAGAAPWLDKRMKRRRISKVGVDSASNASVLCDTKSVRTTGGGHRAQAWSLAAR